jgi:hypothetical protein
MFLVRQLTVILIALFFYDKAPVLSIGDVCYVNRHAVDESLKSHDARCSVIYGNNWSISLDKSYNIYSIVLTVSVANEIGGTSFSLPESQAATSFGSYTVIFQLSDPTQDKKLASCKGKIALSLNGSPQGQRDQGLHETLDCRYCLSHLIE